MAGNRLTTAVARLAERIQCDLLTYTPTSLSRPKPGPQRYLFPVGPLALGLSIPGDEVHLVCVTDNSSNTFWEYIAEKLDREDLPKHDCIVSGPADDATIWLHYCPLPPHFDLATVAAYGIPNFSKPTRIPAVAQQNLAQLKDTWHLLTHLSIDLEAFCSAYQTLRSWAEAAGLFSKALGTLDPDSLLWMLFHAREQNLRDHERGLSPLLDIVQAFANRNWLESLVNREGFTAPSGRKVFSPPPQIAADSYRLIAHEINELGSRPDLLKTSQQEHFESFCKTYRTLVLVKAECWAHKQRVAFHSRLTSQIMCLPSQIRDLRSEVRHVRVATRARIWPHAFLPSENEWIYAIGLEPSRKNDGVVEQVWVPGKALTKLSELLYLDLDTTIGSASLSLCSTREALELPAVLNMTSAPSSPRADTPNAQDESSSKRFPSASQVLSRLRWDPAHTSFNYEVGYLDRFEGLMWLPLEQWGRAVEEEDFIPEHRIRIFRRTMTGDASEAVWDREKRICRLD